MLRATISGKRRGGGRWCRRRWKSAELVPRRRPAFYAQAEQIHSPDRWLDESASDSLGDEEWIDDVARWDNEDLLVHNPPGKGCSCINAGLPAQTLDAVQLAQICAAKPCVVMQTCDEGRGIRELRPAVEVKQVDVRPRVESLARQVIRVANRDGDTDGRWAFVVLALGAVLDGWSLRTTKRAWRRAKGSLSWRQLIRDAKAPDLIVVFLEDAGAIAGVAIAALGLAVASITNDGRWDALASITIGILLMAIGHVVNR